jgi:hypothetical protein
MTIEGLFGSINQARAVGETEVVVGAEVEDGFAVGLDLSELRRGDDSFCLVRACFFHGLEFFREDLLDEFSSLCHKSKIRNIY